MSRNVAVFGGSFNPPHVAHVLAAAFVLSMERIDTLLVVPCFQHPFAKELAPFADRHRMCELAFGWLPNVLVSNVEQDLGGESRTLRTLQTLRRDHPDWSLRLVIGSDVVPETPRWYGFDEIRELAPPIVLKRRGWEEHAQGSPLFPSISSTQIRDAFAHGDVRFAEAWLPPPVLAYARDHGIYTA